MKEALEALPNNIIKYKNPNLTITEKLKAERSTTVASIYPTSEVSSIIPPGEAKNVEINLQEKYAKFDYKDKSFLIHFAKKEALSER